MPLFELKSAQDNHEWAVKIEEAKSHIKIATDNSKGRKKLIAAMKNVDESQKKKKNWEKNYEKLRRKMLCEREKNYA